MKELIFATNNKHKLSEVRPMLEGKVLIHSLSEIGLEGDIPETADTLEGNALQKAQWVYERTGRDCFADDTGLEVDALGGAPGVYSARYAGEGCSFDDNMDKLLAALDGVENRKARFRTVICLLENGQPHYFEGRVEGRILTEKHGTEGFGYDPIFQPDDSGVPFAEMDMESKNRISHRGRAMVKLIDYLKR
ncbi:MAG: non-canonical purine NTP diphosphatase [Bacteroidales bacterium]|nr:non-canonical purine NTP diphosphatase [Bacteroidales bacterium]MBR4198295.1 non-canonical purine NTP diphosphatase [Bacteroidales bacterium]